MTWLLYLYLGAEWILPPAPVEIRPGLTSPATCPASFVRGNLLKIWGKVTGDKARLIIGPGE